MRHWLLNDGRILKARAEGAASLGRPRAAFDVVDRAWNFAQRGPSCKDKSQIPGRQMLKELFSRFDIPVDECSQD